MANPLRETTPDCPDCQTNAVTFIKGVRLCSAHVEQLTELARRREGRTVGTTTSSLLAAVELANRPVELPPRRLLFRAADSAARLG